MTTQPIFVYNQALLNLYRHVDTEFMVFLKKLLRFWLSPPKMSFLAREFKNRPFTLLDIGTGNHSAQYLKRFSPNCEYYGVDLSRDNNDAADFALMKGFYEMDLTSSPI
ncbi:MAG: hypothetical protein ACRERU_16945 [Methylococcales bacterium]